MLELKRFKEKKEEVLFKVYDLLSDNGFEIVIEDGQMNVWYKGCSIEIDFEEGIVIVPDEYQDEFNERQIELYDE